MKELTLLLSTIIFVACSIPESRSYQEICKEVSGYTLSEDSLSDHMLKQIMFAEIVYKEQGVSSDILIGILLPMQLYFLTEINGIYYDCKQNQEYSEIDSFILLDRQTYKEK